MDSGSRFARPGWPGCKRVPATMMKLGFFLYGTGHHIASWRDPGVMANANQSLKHYIAITQTAERGLFDFVFNADSNSTFGPDDPDIWKRTTVSMRLAPL